MNTTKIAQYKIETEDLEKGFMARVINMNSKKEWKSLVYNYRFSSKISRDEWVANFISNIKSWEDRKAQRKAERKAFKNPAKVGDVLCASWGYDQTNIDFYQVIEVNGKMVTVKEIAGSHVEGSGEGMFMADQVTARPNTFIEDSETYKRIVKAGYQGGYYINVDECRMASLTNQTERHYRSWYA
jgi:hypothetical protein